MRYSLRGKNQTFAKGCGFMVFANSIGNNTVKNLSSKYGQELLYHSKKSTTYAFKTTPKRDVKKIAVATGSDCPK